MRTATWPLMFGLALISVSPAAAQVKSGVLTVTGAEMH